MEHKKIKDAVEKTLTELISDPRITPRVLAIKGNSMYLTMHNKIGEILSRIEPGSPLNIAVNGNEIQLNSYEADKITDLEGMTVYEQITEKPWPGGVCFKVLYKTI